MTKASINTANSNFEPVHILMKLRNYGAHCECDLGICSWYENRLHSTWPVVECKLAKPEFLCDACVGEWVTLLTLQRWPFQQTRRGLNYSRYTSAHHRKNTPVDKYQRPWVKDRGSLLEWYWNKSRNNISSYFQLFNYRAKHAKWALRLIRVNHMN